MFESIRAVTKEIVANRKRLFRLASYDIKAQYSGTKLGFLWNFLNPALQIFVYWFVFSVGLRTSAPRDGYPYIIWMIVGIIPWFSISAAITGASGSIYSFSATLQRIPFPLAIVPIKHVVAQMITFAWGQLVVLIILLLSGFVPPWTAWQILYFTLGAFCFLGAAGLLTSAISVVFRDFQQILISLVRLLFYITPVLWAPTNLSATTQFILKLNPLAYVVDGYRDSLLYGVGLAAHWRQGLYFWGFTLVLFAVGCVVHMKLRKKFIDLI